MNTQPLSTEAVWRKLGEELRRFIRRRVPDDELAEDLLQESFLRIHQKIASLADTDRLAAWVYRVARNVVADHFRKSAREGRAPLLVYADPPDDADNRLVRTPCISSQWQSDLILQLPETYQQAVRLAEIEGLAQRQVAQRLGLSLSAAKSRIQRGRALLKEAFEACCRFEFDSRGNLIDVDPRPGGCGCRECAD
jgi:RNA polymerase sigma-70 factor (ECF subfamily)